MTKKKFKQKTTLNITSYYVYMILSNKHMRRNAHYLLFCIYCHIRLSIINIIEHNYLILILQTKTVTKEKISLLITFSIVQGVSKGKVPCLKII